MTKRNKIGDKPPIFNLHVSLDDVEPPVWRRFRVDPLCTLPMLHLIIQEVMGWKNSHLHYFEARGKRYGIKDPESSDQERDERRYRLASLVAAPGESFGYCYDFGDNWTHTIVLEQTLARSRSIVHPKCVGGENACPPEDVGGSAGYRTLRLVLANPDLAQSTELREWVGPSFDPIGFNVEFQNMSLRVLRGTTPPKWM